MTDSIIFVEPTGIAWVVLRVRGGKGGGGGGQTTTSTTQNNDPWSGQQPFLTRGFEESQKLLEGQKPEFFPTSTVVPFSPETEASLGIKTGQAVDPNSLINMAGTETGRTLSGYHLGPESPAFKGILEGVYNQTKPGLDATFAASGRGSRSPGYAEALGRGISTGMTPYLAAERGRMFDATQTALPVSQYAPALLSDVGGTREAQSRNVLQEEIDRHNFEQNVESMKLAQYMQNTTGNYGGTTTGQTTQPLYNNPLMSGLGAAASLVGIGSGLFGPPSGGCIFTGMK